MAEIRLANETGWRELPEDWDAKRVTNLADREWVDLGNGAWCRATAVMEVRESEPDASQASRNEKAA